MLSSPVYAGRHYFNRTDSRTFQQKPEDEWIGVVTDPIVDPDTFERVKARREGHQLGKIDRATTNPTLLGGLVKCGHCGAGMTLMTGKYNRYRYYRCTDRVSKSNGSCPCPNIPEGKLIDRVLDTFTEQVLRPDRLKTVIAQLVKRQTASRGREDHQVTKLKHEIADIEAQQHRLLEAVGKGLLPHDETLTRHAQGLKANREALLVQLARLRSRREMPLKDISTKRLDAFSKALRDRIRDPKAPLARSYLRLFVDEIRVTGREAVISGSSLVLAHAAIQGGEPDASVLSSVLEWRPQGERMTGTNNAAEWLVFWTKRHIWGCKTGVQIVYSA